MQTYVNSYNFCLSLSPSPPLSLLTLVHTLNLLRNWLLLHSFTYSLIMGIVVAPQMTSQPVPFNFLCSPLATGTWQTPAASIPWCYLPISFLSTLSSFTFHCALQDGFGQTRWTEDMSMLLQFASLYNDQVFMESNCLLDLGRLPCW